MKTHIIKKYSKILALTIVLGSTLIGCDDFINDLEPVGAVSDEYFNSEEEYDKALIGAYDMLQSTYVNILTITGAADDIIVGGDANNYDQPTLQRIDKMDQTPADNNQLRDVWKFMYAAMGRANYILEFKDKTEFEGKDEVIAQAYFLRAYFTFELAKFFGDIPLAVEQRDGVSRIQDKRIRIGEQYDVNRVGSVAKVYALIEEDLKEAITNLPVTPNEKYQISKGAAQALLGKVYLYHGTYDVTQFDNAATQLNIVINSGEYSLADLSTLFEKSGENGVESVFEVQYTSVEGAGWDCIQCSEGNYLPQNNAPRDFTGAVYKAGWGFSLPTQQLYDAFENGDQRRDITILAPGVGEYTPSRENTGYFSKKYLPTQENESTRAGSDPLNYENNYRAIRYADVLLMAAEAEVQSSGSIANATAYLNLVRARAFGNNTHDYPYNGESDLLEAIYKERRVELAGEGHRFFDLVRTEKASQAFANYNATKPADFGEITFQENKNEVFPIPLVELELANAVTRWGQNPNY
ncbi:RagB/SusD family nutrient uptake outer membrane protein [Wenyingzhuangia aestuarii]|uniref:RagB/SusD family nutrient uptake outer membrane protein n=1 Tax=Wenyingzhuangia aestuarii TaxID=1647582 RepID=UPI001ADB866A|nr:RagB/SusD family nutrient uptake outer membrane protein [Wenyingzhuangia aestuarii]NJB82550.1 hypothetical protein [Wenyingzhuangia aestuarii]